LNSGAVEGWRRAVGLIMCEMKKCYTKNEEKDILPLIKRIWATSFVHVLRKNCLLKHSIEGKINETLQVTGR
jgi:hypothetical protein